MCESRPLHLVAYPHNHHVYAPPHAVTNVVKVNSGLAILAFNLFLPYVMVKSVTGGTERPPTVITKGPQEKRFSQELTGNDISVFSVSPNDNSFAFETAFEVLLVMKNLLLMCQTPEERHIPKKPPRDRGRRAPLTFRAPPRARTLRAVKGRPLCGARASRPR